MMFSLRWLVLLSAATVVRCAITITAEISPPTFQTTPTWPDRSYYDEDGPPIYLTCPMRSMEGVTLLWYRNGITLQNGELIILQNYNQTMTLIIPKQNQTGTYMCKASNMAGSVNHTGNIYIAGRKQETRPRITATDPEGMVKYGAVGDNITISCVFDVGGNDLALMDLTTTWMKNFSVIPDTNHSTHGINVTESKNQLFSLTITSLKASDYGDYMCLGENKLGNDSKLITVSPPQKHSGKLPLYFIVSISVGGVFVLGIIVMTTMLIRKRRRWNTYKELEWQEPDMSNFQVPEHALQYDVFISYSSNDLTWVKDVLFDTLVANGYSVCIDFKDFTPGMAISENIVDAIYKSRTTIVLLSKNFLHSMWGQFELQQAHNRAVVQRDDFLILIKHDDSKVPVKLMGKTFLDWSDEKVRPHFWQRLYEAIGEPADFEAHDENNLNDIERVDNGAHRNFVNEMNNEDAGVYVDNNDEYEKGDHIIENQEQHKDKEQDELHDSGMGDEHPIEDDQNMTRTYTSERLIYKQDFGANEFTEPDFRLVDSDEEMIDKLQDQSSVGHNEYQVDPEHQEEVREYSNVCVCANQTDNGTAAVGDINNEIPHDLIDLELNKNADVAVNIDGSKESEITDVNNVVHKHDRQHTVELHNSNVHLDANSMINVH